jgi:hypothetical protein
MRFALSVGRRRLLTALAGLALLTLGLPWFAGSSATEVHVWRNALRAARPLPPIVDIALGEEAGTGIDPVVFRSGNLRIYFRGIDTSRPYNWYFATVARPGRRPVSLRFQSSFAGCCTVSVKRLDRSGARYVTIRGFSGGMHCCSDQYVIAADARRPRMRMLGSFDAAPSSVDEDRDIDGDGTVDFLRSDNGFNYQFGGYQESELPPQIWNLIDGRLFDVSSMPPFREVFVRFMAQERDGCLRGVPMVRNAACAAYVAAAARIGLFAPAWRLMLGAHIRDDVYEGRTFPQRLRALLIARHYISRRQRIPQAVI